MTKKTYYFFSFLFLILISLPVLAEEAKEKYTYENAERLKPLIKWQDYTPATFDKAIRENKPIFMLLTAPSWCYWCQVYESEDYLFHPAIVEKINNDFIPIYVDADQRQDLTRQYLEGGWPSTTVMTPSRERLYGFSGPRPVQNMLNNLQQAIDHVKKTGGVNKRMHDYKKKPLVWLQSAHLNQFIGFYTASIMPGYDSIHGGFGDGQKFPQGLSLDYALDQYEKTKNKQWLELVQNTLKNQYTKIDELETNYNLFDPVEGAFHRYGTRRDWTPPHFEKMLYDNARLLKVYTHLLIITPDDPLAKEVVEKTLAYIDTNWYDHSRGGFYGNSDVHGEEVYYAKNPRPEPKARVEKTKYANWNSEAISTYIYLWETAKNPIEKEKYKHIATQSLDFFATEMVNEKGTYHYMNSKGEKDVRGALLDNAYLLLAFVDGAAVDTKYIKTAEQIAQYSIAQLYDWHSGGFFERNSPDKKLYAPGDHLNLAKPGRENGLMAFALLKLYKLTNNELYLHIALRTLGATIETAGYLDFGHYTNQAALYVIEHDLLTIAQKTHPLFETHEKKEQEKTWLNAIIEETQPTQPTPSFIVSDEGLDKQQGAFIVFLFIALVAGVLSFISPCTLPILPAFLAYTLSASKKKIAGMTMAFFLGLSGVFSLLGMSATLIGSFLKKYSTLFSQIAGAGIMLFGILLLFGKGFSGFRSKPSTPTSYAGSFVFGTVLGISWTPCVGPILVAILLLASTTGSALGGGFLLFMYSIGLALPLLLVALYLERINQNSRLWRLIRGKELRIWRWKIHTTTLVSALLFIVLGYLIFSGILFTFNKYLTTTGFQKWIFALEDLLLRLLQ